ncbi:hypothetical protein OG943_15495 [Amycolatopsis sp. NBC_00345]|uniref:hypothetical protein n=1 Tax=Amycolatopsis sp. NBC_00345 TaxID=2975955 RepID=UPI002E25E297
MTSNDDRHGDSSPFEGWEEITARFLLMADLIEVIPEFVLEPASTTWLWRELDREARAFARRTGYYRQQAEAAARWHAAGAPQDPQAWRAEALLAEKDEPDGFRPVPKPRDPRRGGERGDHE